MFIQVIITGVHETTQFQIHLTSLTFWVRKLTLKVNLHFNYLSHPLKKKIGILTQFITTVYLLVSVAVLEAK